MGDNDFVRIDLSLHACLHIDNITTKSTILTLLYSIILLLSTAQIMPLEVYKPFMMGPFKNGGRF